MQDTPILVLAAAGKTGSRLARRLSDRGLPLRRALRRPLAPGDIAFDWSDPQRAAEAFRGVRSAYVVAPTDRSDHAALMLPVLRQALDQGTRRIVLLSAAALERGGPMMGEIHDFLAREAEEWTVLRPDWFMQNFMEGRHLNSLRTEGRILSATGQARLGFIDAGDIARVAEAALLAPQAWNTDTILTGPEALSYEDIAAHLSRAAGRPVRHQPLSGTELREALIRQGLEPAYAALLAGMDTALSEQPLALTDEVLRRTGQAPLTFAQCLASDPDFRRRLAEGPERR